MAFKLNEKTLEPHNGDYIAFLKEIEKGNAKVSGLTVSVNSDMPGMVTVRRTNESDQASSSPGFIAKNKNAMPALLRLAGSVIALFGVLFIIAGMSEPSLQNLIPVGMFVTFGGPSTMNKGSLDWVIEPPPRIRIDIPAPGRPS